MVARKSTNDRSDDLVQMPATRADGVCPEEDWGLTGELVSFSANGARGKARRLDGFYRSAEGRGRKGAPLLLFVHGMGSNFYRSALKKAFLEVAPERGLAVLSFNNRGAERGTEDERFSSCLADLDAAMAFARRRGHRTLVVVGHSTGCQKAVFWQAKRGGVPGVAGVVLLAPADDHAVLRRDLGRRFAGCVAWARRQVAEGRAEAEVPGLYERFQAGRFLSVASERAVEANLFRYAGPLTFFGRVRCPLLAVFGEEEEFAAIPPAAMLERLRQRTGSVDFRTMRVAGTGHSFKGCERWLAGRVCGWAKERV